VRYTTRKETLLTQKVEKFFCAFYMCQSIIGPFFSVRTARAEAMCRVRKGVSVQRKLCARR